tara:strand:- start:417 stop:1430 length:1014 start_codon:yes stop_codon:yes gene_type:complete
MKQLVNILAIFFASIILCEIILYLIFNSPLRLYYPFGKEKVDIQTDFNVTYNVDWRTGNRKIKCNNSEAKNKKVIFIGDSFTFGQGLKEEDTFVNMYACKTNNDVQNLSAVGIGFELYEKIILNHNFQNVDFVYLIFYDNDFDINKENQSLKITIKNFLRYKSFTYLIFRKIKNKYFYGFFRGDNLALYKGKWNNPSSVFKNNPYKLKEEFETTEIKKEYIEKKIFTITKHINNNSKAKIIIMVIPEPSVLSLQHVNFYKSVGALYLPDFLEVSDFAKYINSLSITYEFEYLPFYEHLIEAYKEEDHSYYFDHDFHFNKKGSTELFNYIILESSKLN